MIDLKEILGEPYRVITEQTIVEGLPVEITKEVLNGEFVANGVLFLFVLVLMGNILLRTIFRRGR